MERLVFDEMQKMIDPGAFDAFRRIEQGTRNERGQTFFSPPGSGFPPERGPKLGRRWNNRNGAWWLRPPITRSRAS